MWPVRLCWAPPAYGLGDTFSGFTGGGGLRDLAELGLGGGRGPDYEGRENRSCSLLGAPSPKSKAQRRQAQTFSHLPPSFRGVLTQLAVRLTCHTMLPLQRDAWGSKKTVN